MDAVVKRDRRILETLPAGDFLLLGEGWAGDRELTDKTRYIENSLTLIEAKSFASDKTRVL